MPSSADTLDERWAKMRWWPGICAGLWLSGAVATVSCTPSGENLAGPPRHFSWLSEAQPWPKQPARIIPGSSEILDILLALEVREQVVALPADSKRYSVAASLVPYRDLPQFERFSAEALLALEPDLILASPWNTGEAKAALRRRGVAVVDLPPMERLDEVLRVLRELGAALGAERAAESRIKDLESRANALLDGAAARRGHRILGYSTYGGIGRTPGKGTSFDEVLRLIGATNAATAAGIDGHASLSFEQLLQIDADFIVISKGSPLEGDVRQTLLSTPALRGLRALQKGRLLQIEGRLLAANSQVLVDAAEALASALDQSLKDGLDR